MRNMPRRRMVMAAMTTTTAVVSGLSCLELLKLAKRNGERRLERKKTLLRRGTRSRNDNNDEYEIEVDEDEKSAAAVAEKAHALATHRNSFLSLALPVFAFSEPVQAGEYPWGNRGLLEEDEDDDEEYAEEEDGDGSYDHHKKKAHFSMWDCLDLWPVPTKTMSSSSSFLSPSASPFLKDDGENSAGSKGQHQQQHHQRHKHQRRRWRHLSLGEVIRAVEEAAGEGAVVRGLSCQEKLVYSDLAGGGGGGGKDGEVGDGGLPSSSDSSSSSDSNPRLDVSIVDLLIDLRVLSHDDDDGGSDQGTGNSGASSNSGASFNGRLFVDLEALVEDEEDGAELEVPSVRYHLAAASLQPLLRKGPSRGLSSSSEKTEELG
jgi:hypothetical protein